MGLRLGDIAPNFKAKTTAGDIDFYEYLGDSWGILFLTLQIIHLFALLNSAKLLCSRKNSGSGM